MNHSPKSFARRIRLERVVWLISVAAIITGIVELRCRATPPPSILNRRIAHIEMRGVPLAEALKQIGDDAGATIVVDQAELKAEKVDLSAPITMDVHDVELGAALKPLIAASVPKLFEQFTPKIVIEERDGRIYITSARKMPAFTRAYDVRDILDRWAAVPPIKDETESAHQGSWAPLPPPLTREEMAAKIAEAIAAAIGADNNVLVGGPMEVTSLGPMIVVNAPPSVHQAVGVFLQRFRESVPSRPDQ